MALSAALTELMQTVMQVAEVRLASMSIAMIVAMKTPTGGDCLGIADGRRDCVGVTDGRSDRVSGADTADSDSWRPA